ncbi:BnaC04g29810D [Brassica napus]|uniref:BnaC04g29810D protein n=1 Tax=Brassica napus TaxID=3708 RepID=A0A078HK28_BRANA|nr:BnaC04g29810D [Brassica napus]
MVELLFLLSFLVELQSNCFQINLENELMKNGGLISRKSS